MRPSSAPLGRSRSTRATTNRTNKRRKLGTSPIRSFNNRRRPETAGKPRKPYKPRQQTPTQPKTSKAYLATLAQFSNDPNLIDALPSKYSDPYKYFSNSSTSPATTPNTMSAASHPVLDGLNTRLGLRDVDLLLRNRGFGQPRRQH